MLHLIRFRISGPAALAFLFQPIPVCLFRLREQIADTLVPVLFGVLSPAGAGCLALPAEPGTGRFTDTKTNRLQIGKDL